ncbi:MAG: AAA family ATPase [Chthoniobacteraceae bacterium]|nr:AAA family ATPase [Chthoniobacteraceae bacterium]
MANLDSLRAALAVSPDNVPLLLLFAQGCLDEWAFDDARGAFDRALRVNPNQPDAKLGIARTLHLTGKTSEALVRTEALTREHPNFAPALVFLSQLHLAEGNREEALTHYTRALKLDPSSRDEAYETELYLQGNRPGAAPREPEKVPVGADGGSYPGEDTESARQAAEIERPQSSFADVGGMEAVKEEIRMKIIYPLKNPELFRAYGKKIGGGVLLYGPPGCGKTMLSRATAGEINANFLAVGLHQILDLYLGNSEKNLHELFQLARDNAPSVLFFDEVDALAADRNDLKRSAGRTLINQFLAEMDGQSASNDGLLILGATNAPWHIDPAFRRPGRFDRILFVTPPDEAARAAIIEVMAKNKPVSKLDAAALARKTKDFSGADLKAMFDVAIEHSLARAMREGRVIPITTADLLESAKSLKPSTRAWFDSAKNYALYSNQGGFYDDVLKFLGIKK